MSFLNGDLGGRLKQRRGFALPPLRAQMPALGRQNSGGGLGGGRQSMTILQKKATTKEKGAIVLKKKQAPAVTPQQQSQSTNYTMEEVMRDLQTLEKQQEEAQQKVRVARGTKQRMETNLAELEQHLGDLKYKDEQIRSESKRIGEILSAGQRKLEATKKDTENSENDVHRFHQLLAGVLETKQVLLMYQHKQAKVIRRLEQKVRQLVSLRQTADDRIQQEEQTIQELQEQVEQVRCRVQEEAHKRNSLSQDTTQLRNSSSKLEVKCASLEKQEAAATQKHDDIVRSIEDFETKHSQILQELESQKTKKATTVHNLKAQLTETNHSRESTEKTLRDVHERVETIRRDHRMTASPTGTLPTLEMAYFDALLRNENEATGAEQSKKLEVILEIFRCRSEMQSLQRQIAVLEESSPAKLRRTEELQNSLGILAENETRQKLQLTKTEKLLNDLRTEYEAKLSGRQEKENATKERATQIRNLVAKLASDIDNARTRCAEKRSSCETMKETGKTLFIEADTEASNLRQKIAEMKKEIENLSEKTAPLYDEAPIEDEKFKGRTEKILQNYPTLEAYEIIYDPGLTVQEQTKRDLAPVLKEFSNRVESAKKLRKELAEAARRNDEQQRTLQAQLEEEKQRKEETRRRRESRLKAEGANEPKETRVLSSGGKTPKEPGKRDTSDRSSREGLQKSSDSHRSKESSKDERKRDNSKERQSHRSKKSSKVSAKDGPDAQNASSRKKEKNEREEAKSRNEMDYTYPGGERGGKQFDTASPSPKTMPPSASSTERVGDSSVHNRTSPFDLGPHLDTEEEAEAVVFSAAKPRNLLTTFSQSNSNDIDESIKPFPSSQKKVRWREDTDREVSKKGSVAESKSQSKHKRTFGSGTLALSSSSRSTGQSSKSCSSRSSKNSETAKVKKSTRDDKDRSRNPDTGKTRKSGREEKERTRTMQRDSRDGRKRHKKSTKGSHDASRSSATNTTGDFLASLEGGKAKSHDARASKHQAKEPKRRTKDGESSKSRSKRSSFSKKDEEESKRARESSASNAGDQRPQKRRRNVASTANSKHVTSKSSGATSYGEDFAFGF